MLFVFRVTAGQEKIVGEMIGRRAKNSGVLSVVIFDSFNGYLIVEATDILEARKLASQITHVKGVLSKPISYEEIKDKFGSYVPKIVSLSKGDIVELTSGSFKGDRAKIIRVDETKDQITIELLDLAVPIPITLKSNMVKLIQKAERQEEEQ